MVGQPKKKVIIVGCGPGLKSYIPPRALYNIKKADILIGSLRLLKLFPNIEAAKIVLDKNYHALAQKIDYLRITKHVVVLVSGDPGFFSYTKILVKELGSDSCVIIPGISSIQLAFAAIGECWDDACFMSLHGRNINMAQLIQRVKIFPKVGILTDQKNTPAVIARRLLKSGIHSKWMFVCENLSLPGENIYKSDLAAAVNIKTHGATMIIIKAM